MMIMVISLAEYRSTAREWLSTVAEPRRGVSDRWGEGAFDVSVFHALSDDSERELLDRIMAWQRVKFDAGYGAITWDAEFGGAGLSAQHLDVFLEEEATFEVPGSHEVFSVTTHLIAPTIRDLGTPEQKDRFIRSFLRTEQLCCQLFSEPGAGSDLANLSTSATRDGDDWVINGQKVWSSGALFAEWGELICRSDFDVPKHQGLTAFMLRLDTPGVEIRPIKQMSGGTSFCEVFFNDVRIPDDMRLGDVGSGWSVALTTLAFERATSGSSRGEEHGGSWSQVRDLARWAGCDRDPVVRQMLAELYVLDRIRSFNGARLEDESLPGAPPGPLHSTSKLQWTQWMNRVSDVVSTILGPRLVADSGEWGTYGWTEHVLGAPGYRIAGGSDEIQRNIIGERVLGLPGEPRVDKGIPFSRVVR